jgi:hypothetical protein
MGEHARSADASDAARAHHKSASAADFGPELETAPVFNLLALQGAAGNAAVNRLIQRGGWEKLGSANPRLYLPEPVGYTDPQTQRVHTRAALRNAGLPGADVTSLMQLHQTSGAPVTYAEADLVQIAHLCQSLGGPWPTAQALATALTQIGQPLPINDLLPLLYLAAVRSSAYVVSLGQAMLAHHLDGARARSIAALPSLPTVADVTALAPLARPVTEIATLLQPFGNVPAASGPQIAQLGAIPIGEILQCALLPQIHAVGPLVQLATAAGRPRADIIALATQAPAVSVANLLLLIPIAKSVPDIVQLLSPFGHVPAATAAQIVQLAGVPNGEIVQLAGVPQAHTVADVIRLAQTAGRPRAHLIALGTNVPGLTLDELVGLAAVPAGGSQLGEAFVQRARVADFAAANWIADAHARAATDRRVVLTDARLSALVSAAMPDNSRTIVMSALLEGSQEWKNPDDNDFYDHFVTKNLNTPLSFAATMNCWESIMYAAFLAGLINGAWIRKFYRDTAGGDENAKIWATLGYVPGLPRYPTHMPTAGQLLFFTDTGDPYPGHVALSLGGKQMMTLWEAPFNITKLQRTTIKALRTDASYGGKPPRVTMVNPPW